MSLPALADSALRVKPFHQFQRALRVGTGRLRDEQQVQPLARDAEPTGKPGLVAMLPEMSRDCADQRVPKRRIAAGTQHGARGTAPAAIRTPVRFGWCD